MMSSWNRRIKSGWYGLVLLAAIGMAASLVKAETVEWVRWRELTDRRLSRWARSVVRRNARDWYHAQTALLTYHARDPDVLRRLIRETEWYQANLVQRLHLPTPDTRGRLIVVDDPADIARLRLAARVPAHGQALHINQEIFILHPPDTPENVEAVPHELVHFNLQQVYGPNLPLWLEEGLAVHLGQEMARTFHARLGRRVTRSAATTTRVLDWETVLTAQEYPSDAATLKAFYRQSGWLVAQLDSRLSAENWDQLLQAQSGAKEGVDPVAELKKMLGWDDAEWTRQLAAYAPDPLENE